MTHAPGSRDRPCETHPFSRKTTHRFSDGRPFGPSISDSIIAPAITKSKKKNGIARMPCEFHFPLWYPFGNMLFKLGTLMGSKTLA